MKSDTPSVWPIALSIICVGALIAYALYSALRPNAELSLGTRTPAAKVSPVTEADHILGDPSAPIKIIVYTDLECPYCRSFHATMKQVMALYGTDGSVAWIYRHFPLTELHPNAPALAEASECAAELGGNESFWKFIDGLFAEPRLNDRFDMSRIEPIAAASGIPLQQFRDCITSGRHRAAILAEFQEAKAAGATGSPYSVLLSTGNPNLPIAGSRSFGSMQDIIESILKNSGN